jgi:hypothetical protein
VTDPTNAIAFNAEAITNCLKHGWGFFDTLNYLGVNVTDQTNSGIMNVDFVHPTVAGDDYLNGKIYAALMGKMAIQSHDHTDPIFQGGEVNLFNSSRTDPLGIGTAFPDKDARLTIQTDAQTEIKFSGGNQSAVITMQGNYLLGGPVGGTNITFQMDGNGDLWVTPGWPSGAGNMGNLIFGQPFPGTGVGTWYPSGGLRLGPATGISDPGAYVLAANALTVLNTTNQVKFGSTNTAPAGVSTPTKWISVQVNGETTVYRLPLYQ